MPKQKKFETCPMLARSDWGVSRVHTKGLAHSLSSNQSSVGFHGPKVGGWLVFLNGCHRGEDVRLPIGETKIGSSWQNDCVITGVGVGSQHAVFNVGIGHAKVAPIAGNRVIKVNNVAINGSKELEDGCLISIGDTHSIFRLSEAFAPGYVPSAAPNPVNMPAQVLPLEMVCGWLVMSRGSCTGQDFRLINGECRFGSNQGLELTIPEAHLVGHAVTFMASPKECRINWVASQVVVKINDVVTALNAVLRDSDFIQIDQLEGYFKWLRN